MTRNLPEYVARFAAISAIAALCCFTSAAHAALGQPYVASNNRTSTQAQIKAAIAVTTTSSLYTTHTTRTDAGTEVREYARADGVVFAVTWQGPFKPDLQTLLGDYFGKFRDAPRQSSAVQRHARLALPDLIVMQSGHMRAFEGKAWDPTLVPAGVVVEELP